MSLEEDLKAQDARPHQPADGELGGRDPAAHRRAPGEPGPHPRRAAGDRRPLRREDQRERDRTAMAEVVASQPPPDRRAGPGFDRLKASLAAVEKGASLSEVLTYLVNEVVAVRRPRGDVHREGPERDRLVRARASSPPSGQADQRPAERRHGVPRRPQLAARRCARWPSRLAGHRAGAGPPRRRAPGRPGRAPHPARQAGRHPLLRQLARTRSPRRSPTSSRSSCCFAGKTIDLLSIAPKPAARASPAARHAPSARRRSAPAATRCASARACPRPRPARRAAAASRGRPTKAPRP